MPNLPNPHVRASDSQEAKDFVKLGFEVSEKFDTPVMVRSVTRISHSKGIVECRTGWLPREA